MLHRIIVDVAVDFEVEALLLSVGYPPNGHSRLPFVGVTEKADKTAGIKCKAAKGLPAQPF